MSRHESLVRLRHMLDHAREPNSEIRRETSMRNVDVLITLFILLLPATLRAEATPRPLESYNWAVNASPNLATNPPPEEAVRKFMEQREDDGESNRETSVCSFRFADLRHAENLSLLVTRYDGGHGGCGALSIVDRSAAGFQGHWALGTNMGIDDVNKVVRDINGDGNLELIIDTMFTDYQGAGFCFATWPVIYGWDGSNYANLSAHPRFRRFYQDEIKSMRQGVSATSDCREASIAKIKRFLGADPNTGMADAIRWANSDQRVEREFAVNVLTDIGTPEAKNYLRTLANDTEWLVASSAKRAFAYGHFGKKRPEAEFLESDDATPQEEADQMNKDALAARAGPWHLIVPPMKGDEVDLKASDSQWNVTRGFDSQEQCQYGVQLLQGYAREGPNYRMMLHGKCILAPTP